MKNRRFVSVLLIFALAASLLTGCGIPGVLPQLGESVNARKTSFFSDIWRGDTAYADMEYEHYKAEWFDEYTDPIYAFGESGGSAEDFSDANFDLLDHLYYVYSLQNLIDIQYSADPTDEYAASELAYTQELYYTLSDEYWAALHAVAASPYADVMKDDYAQWQIDAFADYVPSGEEDLSGYNRENALVKQYYSIMAAKEPGYQDAAADVFAELVNLRNTTYAAYGYASYADYCYDYYFTRDYAPADAEAVWQGAKESFAPLIRDYADAIYAKADDAWNSPQIDCSPDAILSAMERTLPQMSSELYAAFQYMRDYGLCDIERSSAKMDTGFTTTLSYWNEPFIFNCPRGNYYDYTDMFHEFGHFVNAFYIQSDIVFGAPDNDLAELQSQGMEMMFTPYFDDIFGAEYGEAVRNDELLNLVYSVVDGAMYDEFQRRCYAEPELTGARACEIYKEVFTDYGYEPYDGCQYEWISVPHNFEYPFYYISYAVSALSALELYDQLQSDWEKGADRYLSVAAMDCELYYFSEALTEAGFTDVFAPDACADIASVLSRSFQ